MAVNHAAKAMRRKGPGVGTLDPTATAFRPRRQPLAVRGGCRCPAGRVSVRVPGATPGGALPGPQHGVMQRMQRALGIAAEAIAYFVPNISSGER